MVLEKPGEPLVERDLAAPVPSAREVLVRVLACGVCRTDLHVVDGELREPKLPLVPGHQIVGEVSEGGGEADGLAPGERVGIPWLGWTCGECRYCLSGRENLCERALFTGYTLDGGYAEFATADARYCFPLPDGDPVSQAPLLCAGLVGYRALAPVRRRRADRPLRLRWLGPHRLSGRGAPGPSRLRDHARRRRKARFRARGSAPSGPVRRTSFRRSSTPRSSSRRPARWSSPRSVPSAAAAPSSAPAST